MACARNDDFKGHLEKLENLVDMAHVDRTRELQRRAFSFQEVDHVPTGIDWPVPEDEWPSFGFQEIFDDPEKMLLQELRSVYAGAKIQDDRLYGIRANYGTGIIASMFGCPVRTFDDSLPIALSIDLDVVKEALDAGVPDVRSGLAGRALDTVAYYRETLQPYPKLRQVVGSELLDIQGPFCNATTIWGSEIFLAVLDEPDMVCGLMNLVVDTTLALIREHRCVDGQALSEDIGWWAGLGGLCLRADSCINLSGCQYRELVMPSDARLLADYGGWVHFCGRAHQWWEALLELPKMRGINPLQGEFYDLEPMYDRCESESVPIIQWIVPLNDRCRERIHTGFSRIMSVPDYDSALRAVDRLHSTGHADS